MFCNRNTWLTGSIFYLRAEKVQDRAPFPPEKDPESGVGDVVVPLDTNTFPEFVIGRVPC